MGCQPITDQTDKQTERQTDRHQPISMYQKEAITNTGKTSKLLHGEQGDHSNPQPWGFRGCRSPPRGSHAHERNTMALVHGTSLLVLRKCGPDAKQGANGDLHKRGVEHLRFHPLHSRDLSWVLYHAASRVGVAGRQSLSLPPPWPISAHRCLPIAEQAGQIIMAWHPRALTQAAARKTNSSVGCPPQRSSPPDYTETFSLISREGKKRKPAEARLGGPHPAWMRSMFVCQAATQWSPSHQDRRQSSMQGPVEACPPPRTPSLPTPPPGCTSLCFSLPSFLESQNLISHFCLC